MLYYAFNVKCSVASGTMNSDRTANRLNLLEGARMNYRMLKHLNMHSSIINVQTVKAEKVETTKFKFNPKLKENSSPSDRQDIRLSKADDSKDKKSTLIGASESTNLAKNTDNQKADSNQSTYHKSNLSPLLQNMSDEEINKIWMDNLYKHYDKLVEVGYVEPKENMKQKDHHLRPPQNMSEEHIDEIWKDVMARKVDAGTEVIEVGKSSDSMVIEGDDSIISKNSVEKHIVISKSKMFKSSKESTECLSESSYDDDSTILSYSKSDEKCFHLKDSNDSHNSSSTPPYIDSITSSDSSIG